jgi:hypothetical protein
LTYIFAGISVALFFVYYNVGHFLYTPKERTGVSGGVMYAISPAISIFAPIIAGSLATSNINHLWFLSLLSFALAYGLTFKQEDFSISYKLKESLAAISSIRVPIFLEGIWESVIISVIPISTLHFITSPAGYGQYLGYLSLIGTIAGLLIGQYSDKLGKRSFLILPICLILSISTIGLIFGLTSLPVLIVVTIIIQFMIPIFLNITTALMIDQNLDLKVAFPGREIVLAFGRLLGLAFTYLCIINSQINLLLVILSLVILALPAYLQYHNHISKKYSYL